MQRYGDQLPELVQDLRILQELRRQLRASAAYLPVIDSIGAVTWDGEKVSCEVTLGGSTTTEVISVEP